MRSSSSYNRLNPTSSLLSQRRSHSHFHTRKTRGPGGTLKWSVVSSQNRGGGSNRVDNGKEDGNDSIIIHDNSTEILNILWILKDLSLTIELKLVAIIEDNDERFVATNPVTKWIW